MPMHRAMNPFVFSPFAFSRMPELHFGAGRLADLPNLLVGNKTPAAVRILLITGASSFARSAHYGNLTAALADKGITHDHVTVIGEPTPDFVDSTVARFRGGKKQLDWVVAIGGGSAIDAGKAISAMLPQSEPVSAFLEGRATKQHDGSKVPFIAVPTSSGTGAEATKNAVLSEIGEHGFKSSLRHDNFVPDIALIDPELMLSCPPAITAACGLDALTQLLESYVASSASPLTDALAESGLAHAQAGFVAAFEHGDTDLAARAHMAYAALMSGVTLANAGLGVVHGFAGPLGGFFPIPHGIACGTLLGEATRRNIETLFAAPEKHRVALEKYAKAGAILSGRPTTNQRDDCGALLRLLDEWIALTKLPRLSAYGIRESDFPRILDKSNNKNSPVTLDREQMQSILKARL